MGQTIWTIVWTTELHVFGTVRARCIDLVYTVPVGRVDPYPIPVYRTRQLVPAGWQWGGARRDGHVISLTNGVDFLITAAVLYILRPLCERVGSSLGSFRTYTHTHTYMAEYQKILQNGPQLRVAFQDHLVSLSDLFMSVGLISSDNASEVTNRAISTPHRASKMLEFVRNKVKLNKENYRVFVKALQQDVGQYGDILKIRE